MNKEIIVGQNVVCYAFSHKTQKSEIFAKFNKIHIITENFLILEWEADDMCVLNDDLVYGIPRGVKIFENTKIRDFSVTLPDGSQECVLCQIPSTRFCINFEVRKNLDKVTDIGIRYNQRPQYYYDDNFSGFFENPDILPIYKPFEYHENDFYAITLKGCEIIDKLLCRVSSKLEGTCGQMSGSLCNDSLEKSAHRIRFTRGT